MCIEELYAKVRARTELLCRPLAPDDYGAQSMPDASPAKWHLGHTTWFFETFVLRRAERHYRPHAPAWRPLFNSYYDAEGERLPRGERGLLVRPTLAEVQEYRRAVDERMLQLLGGDELGADVRGSVELGLQHEQQHQELLLTDLQHLYGLSPLSPRYAAAEPPRATRPERAFIGHPGGLVEIGHAGAGFAFDNESPRHRIYLEPFDLAAWLVTNAEYLEFMRDGGYARPELWLADGWAFVQREGLRAPLYLREREGAWFRHSLYGEVPLDPAAPVTHVSFYEADAFARWAGARLPSEAEWEVTAAASAPSDAAPEDRLLPLSTRALLGEAWVWTGSPYVPYPGFRPAEGALGEYNGKFMCNQLVLRGGSCFSPKGHARATYRNFFYPTARWQVTGIRLARAG